jgi:hypothetical protein
MGCLLTPALLSAQEVKPVPAEDPVHKDLRALRDRVLEAFNKNDLDGLLRNVHENAVMTWQDAEVCRGHKGIRDYYNRMMTGPNRVVESVKATAEVDELTILYGDKNGLAFGRLDEEFKLTNGMDFQLPNRWTANVVKEGDRWLIAGFHVSANVFDNPVQHMIIRRTAWWTGGIALLVGILLGVVGTAFVRRLRGRRL